jgi:hypothetical protein
LPSIVFRFLFPHADSPIWPSFDLVKAPINSIPNLINDYFFNNDIYENSELPLDEETGEIIKNYYN